ncbi:MAG: PAS domain-containing protein [Planctomycetes bacterium]|nr:PAS domain-containing protein [Planctomycetota bacterium]
MNPEPLPEPGVLSPDVRRPIAAWSELQHHVVGLLAQGAELKTILDAVVRGIELALPGRFATIMRRVPARDELVLAAWTSLPNEYAEATSRAPIAPGVGTCGSAAYSRSRVVTEDIAVDPRWAPVRDAALRHGLRACWSQPILSSTGALLGTFGLYQTASGAPTAEEIEHVEGAAHLVGIAIERAETERARRLHHSIVTDLIDSVIVIDGDLRIVECNPATERIFGYKRDELIGQSPLMLYPENQRTFATAEEILTGIRTQGRWHGERSYQTKDGRIGTRVMTVLRLEDSLGNGQGFLSLHRDVTEERRAALEQEDLRSKMLQTQKLESLGILAGGIAHDFNNLLTGILGNAELALHSDELPARTRSALLAIQRSAGRAADLTRQMLAYSGRATFQRARVDLSAEVREIGALLASSIAKKVELRFQLASDLPPIDADRAQLQQLVMNLVINAAEAIGDDTGEVLVSTWAWTNPRVERDVNFPTDGLPPGSYSVLEVRDDGCGMDEATMQRIFDPFFTTKFTGRGLGLAAVLGIVRAHDGGLKVQTELGRGTAFRVFLPVSTKERVSPVDPARESPETLGTVLVIDDEPVVAELATSVLQPVCRRVHSAVSGETGLALFEAHADEIDLVLLDVTMPKLGAREILDVLHRRRPDVKVVLTSGYSETEVSRRFAQGEFEGFLQKPYSPSSLLAVLRAAVARG